MAASEELRIVPVRGLNDIHKKRTHLPKPVMGLLQGLQYSLPTFAFHTFGACCTGTRGFPHHAAALPERERLARGPSRPGAQSTYHPVQPRWWLRLVFVGLV